MLSEAERMRIDGVVYDTLEAYWRAFPEKEVYETEKLKVLIMETY